MASLDRAGGGSSLDKEKELLLQEAHELILIFSSIICKSALSSGRD